MQDDFGDFLQASSATSNTNTGTGPAAGGYGRPTASINTMNDLSSKLMDSFNLSGTNQKASFRFRQPEKRVGKRPQNVQFEQSSSSANWKNLDLKTSEFTVPIRHRVQKQHHPTPVSQQSRNYNYPVHPVGGPLPNYHQNVVQNFQPLYGQPQMSQNVDGPRMNFQTHFSPAVQADSMFNQPQGMYPGPQMPSKPSLMHVFAGHISNNMQDQARFMQSPTNLQGNSIRNSVPIPVQAGPRFSPTVMNNIPQSQMAQRSAQPSHSPISNVVHHELPKTTQGKRCDFNLPSWMTKPSEIPQLYKDVLKLCATPNSFADTSRLYPIFLSSQLPKDVLGHIWSAANQSTPGQLTFSEVYIALALIALAQKGEMNLTAKYVMNLRAPPIPKLQLHAKSSSIPLLPQQASLGNFPDVRPQTVQKFLASSTNSEYGVDDFAEFQSVPPALSSTSNQLSFSGNVNPVTNNFQEFQSYVPISDSSATLTNFKAAQISSYPDRSLINSPKAGMVEELKPSVTIQSKPLLQSIDFSKFKSDPMKALQTAAKSLNLTSHSVSSPSLSSNLTNKDNEFGAFRMNTSSSGNDVLTADTEEDDFSDFSSAPSHTSNTDSLILGNVSFKATSFIQPATKFNPSKLNGSSITKPGDGFGEFKSSSTQSQAKFPTINGSMVAGTTNDNSPKDLMTMGAVAGMDKYSALRDLMPPVTPASTIEFADFQSVSPVTQSSGDIIPPVIDPKSDTADSSYEFAEFQSVPPVTKNSEFPTVMNDIINSEMTKSASSSFPSFFGKSVMHKEDSQSVNSLELPSLSKTISNLSIGSSSPSQGVDDLYSVSSYEKNGTAFGEFANFDIVQTNVSTRPSNFDTVVTIAPIIPPRTSASYTKQQSKSQNDGLYSLDEPISPPVARKYPQNEKSSEPKPLSPPKVKRFVVPRKISEADSDFGDFSSGPPPIDDSLDHHNAEEFDLHQGGNSALVDFDAFGHLDETKEEIRKKKETEFHQKRGKEDATAFSEFVKTSIGNLKPPHEVNGASNEEHEKSEPVEGDWSASHDGGTIIDGSDRKRTELPVQILSSDDQLTVELNIGGDNESINGTTWKLESTISESEFENIDKSRKSKWDEEGEELKARMEGNLTSNPMELYVDHWGRCLTTCKDIIVSTGEIFAALNSPSVCHEIVNSKRGKEFISCTSEVYAVARRIRKGMGSVGLLDEDLEQNLKDIEIAWNNLLGFCPYTPSVHKTPEHCCVPGSDSNDSRNSRNLSSACSLCLLSTNESVPIGLEYGGKSYHAPCANLWLNQIAPILPRLELPAVF